MPLYPTQTSVLQEKVRLDIVYILSTIGKKFLVITRDNLSGQPKVRALSNVNTALVVVFIQEDIIYRYRMFIKLVIDGGLENKVDVKDL